MRKLWIVIILVLAFKAWGWIRSENQPELMVTNAKVELYATEWCGYCARARSYFADHGVDYVEFDIEKDSQAHARYKDMGGKGVPLTVIDNQIIYGFNQREFDHQLGL